MNTRYNLNRLSYFAAIVEEKTITAAAARLGLSKAVVSKQLQLLEEEIGVNLLVRNTRHIRPTEAGEDFYQRSKEVLIQAAEAFESVQETRKEPAGRIRLTAPIDFGSIRLAPYIARFSRLHPKIEIESVLTDQQFDIVEQRFDLAFRIGWLKDSTNLARKLDDFREVVVCDKKTARKWNIQEPNDLSLANFVSYSGVSERKWVFAGQSRQRTVYLSSSISFNVTTAVREAVLAGNCFGILPDFAVAEDLTKGRLVELLPKWRLRKGGIYIISPPSRLRTQSVNLFMESVTTEFGA